MMTDTDIERAIGTWMDAFVAVQVDMPTLPHGARQITRSELFAMYSTADMQTGNTAPQGDPGSGRSLDALR